LIDLESHR